MQSIGERKEERLIAESAHNHHCTLAIEEILDLLLPTKRKEFTRDKSALIR